MVECHASDLTARVRFPLPAPNNLKSGTFIKIKINIIDRRRKIGILESGSGITLGIN